MDVSIFPLQDAFSDALHSYTTPFPARTNPHYSERKCTQWVETWLSDLKLTSVLSSHHLQKLVKADIPRLTAMFQPDAGEWEYSWCCKFLVWLFITDDILDESDPTSALEIFLDIQSVCLWSFPDDPTLLENQDFCLENLDNTDLAYVKRKAFSEEMAEARTRARTHPQTAYAGELCLVGNLFCDLWAYAVESLNQNQLRLMAHFTQEFLIGARMEMGYRNCRRIAKPSTMIQIRRLSSGCKLAAAMSDVTNAVATPTYWIYSNECQRMIQAMNDFVTWHNDIWSFKKEVLDKGDVINMILVFSKDRNISYDEAANLVFAMVHDRVTEFGIAEAELEKVTPPELQHNFVIYREACRNMMAGTNDWHKTCHRFY